LKKKGKKEFIIMVGYQGSGKSTISKNILNKMKLFYEIIKENLEQFFF
jgi:shikimate kinase